MRVLITGITGFVGKYLEKQLNENGVEVFGTSKTLLEKKNHYPTDLLDKESTIKLIKEVKPTHIFHLAGMSNVKDSWSNISETMEVNLIGTANLLEAIYKVDNGIRVLTIGSSEEYGCLNKEGKKISEETDLCPANPYGLSKATVSKLVQQFKQSYGLDIIHVRPFNHIGPGQKRGFVTSDFAYQIALINKGKNMNNKITVGNLESIRDFTDVRDIVKAYYLLALKGKSGEVYNVCSGKGTKIQNILDILISFSEKVEIEIQIDPQKRRVADIPYFVGDYTKLNQLTNWKPSISLYSSLKDIYISWLKLLE